MSFPDAIARGATGGSEYSTDVVMVASGFEQRNQKWSTSRARYDISRRTNKDASPCAVRDAPHGRRISSETAFGRRGTGFRPRGPRPRVGLPQLAQ